MLFAEPAGWTCCCRSEQHFCLDRGEADDEMPSADVGWKALHGDDSSPLSRSQATPSSGSTRPSSSGSTRPSRVFELELRRSSYGEHLGLHLVPLNDTAQVLKVDAKGLIGQLNDTAAAEQKVRLYDLLIEVNGCIDRKTMGERLKQDMDLRVRVARPETFTVAIDRGMNYTPSSRDGDSPARSPKNRDYGFKDLGLELTSLSESISLFISSIGTGAVAEYNETAQGALQVRKADLIASVNGRRGRGGELRKALATGHRWIELGLLRPPFEEIALRASSSIRLENL